MKVEPGQATEDQELERGASRELSLETLEHSQILEHRGRFSEISYGIMQAWVGFIIVLTCAQFSLRSRGFGLEVSEFIAVVTTTTLAVFGFGLLVGNFFFPKGGSSNRRK